MKPKRITMAPSTPQKSTRCWSESGTQKCVKISAITTMLSSDRLYSTRYAVK